jgi:hypothetical protein
MIWFSFWAIGGTAAAATNCPALSSLDDLRGTLTRAEDAYAALEVDGLKLAFEESVLVLPCMGETVDPPTASQFHRVRGLYLFMGRDLEGAQRSFAASRRLDSSAEVSIAPPGHPLQKAYMALDPADTEVEELPSPGTGELRIDGLEDTHRPIAWPIIVQHLNGMTPSVTAFVDYGALMPAYPLEPPEEDEEKKVVEPPEEEEVVALLEASEPALLLESEPVADPTPIVVPPTPTTDIRASSAKLAPPIAVSALALAAGVGTIATSSRMVTGYAKYLDIVDDMEAEAYYRTTVKPNRNATIVQASVAAAALGTSIALWTTTDFQVKVQPTTAGLTLSAGGRL